MVPDTKSLRRKGFPVNLDESPSSSARTCLTRCFSGRKPALMAFHQGSHLSRPAVLSFELRLSAAGAAFVDGPDATPKGSRCLTNQFSPWKS